MSPRHIPILLAALLISSCSETAPPPPLLRLQVTTTGVFTDGNFATSDITDLKNWLSEKIAGGEADRDVRLDFACNTPVSLMLNTIDHLSSAGAGIKSGSGSDSGFAFNIEGWNGDDFALKYPEPETCCIEETQSGADKWGAYTITEKHRGPLVEFALTITGGTVCNEDGMELLPGDLTELFKTRSRDGHVCVTICTDLFVAAGDLLPVLMVSSRRGAAVNILSAESGEKLSDYDQVPLRLELGILNEKVFSPLSSAMRKRPSYFGIPQTAALPPEAPPPWIPEHFLMAAGFRLALHESRGTRLGDWSGF